MVIKQLDKSNKSQQNHLTARNCLTETKLRIKRDNTCEKLTNEKPVVSRIGSSSFFGAIHISGLMQSTEEWKWRITIPAELTINWPERECAFQMTCHERQSFERWSRQHVRRHDQLANSVAFFLNPLQRILLHVCDKRDFIQVSYRNQKDWLFRICSKSWEATLKLSLLIHSKNTCR